MYIHGGDTMAGYDISQLRILLVDDDTLMRNLIKSMLRSLDVNNVKIVESAEVATSEIQIFNPDIIVLDWEMPNVNGLELTKQIRQSSDYKISHTPIIMLTGYTAIERVIEARNMGINDFLAKPVSVKRLYQRILSIVKKPRDFVKTKNYFGPDRRRQQLAFAGEERRKNSQKTAKIA